MEQTTLLDLARALQAQELTPEEFTSKIMRAKSAPLADTTLDLDRWNRCGYPEVVYGSGKTLPSLVRIVTTLCDAGQPVLVTRLAPEKSEGLAHAFPQGTVNSTAGTFRIGSVDATTPSGRVAIVTAGTSDLPVAEEAQETAAWMGAPTQMIHDVGVAGPHRLPVHVPELRTAAAVIVVAGMEGALPSVVGGYVAVPVIGVPTSVGYGAALGGMAALLGMLNSCAANVTVVNIDAGFKAGYVAAMIARHAAAADTGSKI